MKLIALVNSYFQYPAGTKESVKVLVPQLCLICNLMICPWNSPGENTGVSCHSLLQGIFPTRDWTQVSWFRISCRQILYHLSHQGSAVVVARIWAKLTFSFVTTEKFLHENFKIHFKSLKCCIGLTQKSQSSKTIWRKKIWTNTYRCLLQYCY